MQCIHRLMDAKDTMVGGMDFFEDARNEYQENQEAALDKEQRLLDGMIRFLEGLQNSNADVGKSCRSSTRSPSPTTRFAKRPRAGGVAEAGEDPKDGHARC